jgi:hypothetical protein
MVSTNLSFLYAFAGIVFQVLWIWYSTSLF